MPPAAAPAHDVPAPMVVAVVADSCASCGVHLAPDQRYCVECGQPRGATRLPSVEPTAVHEEAAWTAVAGPPSPPTRRRWGWSVPNATVLAGIGALLLAVGVGVLIGRSGRGATSAGPQRVTVVLSGSGAPVAAAAPVATTPTHATAAAGAAAASAKKAAATKSPAAKTPPPKVVSVGSKGTGPGYQGGKFTGNFFGGGGG